MPTVISATAIDDPNQRIALHEAQARWVRAAQEVLEETAATWAAVIGERELAEEIQRRSGVRTRNRRAAWLPKVLGLLIMYAHSRDKPQLVSLVVDADGGPVPSYSGVLMLGNAAAMGPAERDAHVLAQRMRCYRECGAAVPEGATAADLVQPPHVAPGSRGGTATVSPPAARVGAPRPRQKPDPVEPVMQVCSTCWLQKPPGVPCPNCE